MLTSTLQQWRKPQLGIRAARSPIWLGQRWKVRPHKGKCLDIRTSQRGSVPFGQPCWMLVVGSVIGRIAWSTSTNRDLSRFGHCVCDWQRVHPEA